MERRIVETTTPTRGGQPIETLTPRDTTGRTTAIAHAAARKRILTSRYLSLAVPNTTYKHGVLGPTGEAVVRHAIVQAGNLALTTTGAGEVKKILGLSLQGSLDSGGWLPVMDKNEQPAGMVYIPIEVKNIRDWTYPQSSELFQVLDKAAQLQRHAPTTLILPLLICRRVNHTIFFMAKQLGFKVRDNRQQYVRPVLRDEELAEVRTELGFTDLMPVEPGTTATPPPEVLPDRPPQKCPRLRPHLARNRPGTQPRHPLPRPARQLPARTGPNRGDGPVPQRRNGRQPLRRLVTTPPSKTR